MPEKSSDALKPIKWYKNLNTKKGRFEAGVFLVEGARAIDQIISSDENAILEIITTGEPPHLYEKYPLRSVNETQLKSISSTQSPQGIIAVVNLPRDTYTESLPANTGDKILLLEDIQDPGNIGTLIRTAAAFNFSGILLTENCADPFSPKVVQSTAGTILSVWIRRTAHYLKLVKELISNGYLLAATDLAGTENPSILQRNDKLLLALGTEATGLSDSVLNIANHRIRIPIHKEKAESLNVAISGAICMYLTTQKA